MPDRYGRPTEDELNAAHRDAMNDRAFRELLTDLAQDEPPGSVLRDEAERLRLIRHHQTPVPDWCVVGAYAREGAFPHGTYVVVRLGPAYVYLENSSGMRTHVRYEHLPLWTPVPQPPAWREPTPIRGRMLHGIILDDAMGFDGESNAVFRQEYQATFMSDTHAGERTTYFNEDGEPVMTSEPVDFVPVDIRAVAFGGDLFEDKSKRRQPADAVAPPSRFDRDFDVDD